MSISIPNDLRLTSTLLADAIIYAVNHNADVINIPWSSFGNSEYIYDAIGCAHINGRNGRGSVVVLGAGNWGGPIMFPAETYPDNIVVGATSECGTRKSQESCGYHDWWESCYGDGLDVVAPGKNIKTTSNGFNYTTEFEGTSASCAQVSAIAGLILSLNPNLSAKEVGTIINSTARKVGPYSYDSIAPDGNWNFEMGHGLVDAYAAVKKAQLSTFYISGPTYLCDALTTYRALGTPDDATFQWHLSNLVGLEGFIGSSTNDTVVIGLDKLHLGINDSIIWRGGDDLKWHFHDSPYPAMELPDSAMLSVTVTKDGISYTKRKVICGVSRGKPEFVCSDTSTYWQRYTPRTFTITNCYEIPDNRLEWTISLIYPIYEEFWSLVERGRVINFIPTYIGTYEVSVVNLDKDCSSNSSANSFIVVSNLPAKSVRNITTNVVNVQQNEQHFTTKILRDGQLYIIHDNKEYNANGVLIR